MYTIFKQFEITNKICSTSVQNVLFLCYTRGQVRHIFELKRVSFVYKHKRGYLEVRTSLKASDMDQAYGAGYLEGALTANFIYSHWYNTARRYCTDQPDVCKNLTDFMAINKNWIKSQLQNDSDPYLVSSMRRIL